MAKVIPMKPTKKAAGKPADAESPNTRAIPGNNSGISPKVLKGIVDEIERAEDEKKDVADLIKDIYTAAKAKGYDVKVIRRLVSDRRKDKEKLREFKDKLEQYAFALDPELAEVLS